MLYLLFILVAFFIALLGGLVVATFYRNRYEGDLTPFFSGIFVLSFLLCMVMTIIFMSMAGVTPPDQFSTSFNSQQ
jgi:NADH:ubiquinone oxidoreductase subunit 2 (subunit N)